MNKLTIFETFVGAGGSHLGFKQNGFKSVFVNDISKDCIDTLLYNNPEIKKTAIISIEDMTTINPSELRKKMKMEKKDLDTMFGGIVCKGFSLAGERSPNDPRNVFYHYQLDFVKEFLPKISVIENVPGILNAQILGDNVPEQIRNEVDMLWQKLEDYKGKKANLTKHQGITKEFEEEGKKLRSEKERLLLKLTSKHYLISVKEDILNIYGKLGYTVYIKILNSAWYGAATKRERVIIVAVRNDIDIPFEYPKPLFESEIDFKTVGEALKEIDYSKDDSDNVPMKHSPKTISRFKYIDQGENLASKIDLLPADLKISKFYSRGSTMRLDSKKCSPTLVPGHSNFPVHPFEDRCITVREAATITGFPINYHFIGSQSKRCEEVGNAVPPPLSFVIAKQCKKILLEYYKKNK